MQHATPNHGPGRDTRSPLAPRGALPFFAVLAIAAAGCGGGGDPCDGGGCVCESESTCDFLCDGDRCAATCASTSVCNAACDDFCDLACVDSSDCNLACDTACIVTCDAVSTCAVDCGVDCDVSCSNLSSCDVLMISGVVDCGINVSSCLVGCLDGDAILPPIDEGGGVFVCP